MIKPREKSGRGIVLFGLSVVLTLVVIYAGVLAALLVFQSRLVFFPDKSLSGTPADIGLVFEEVRFSAADGVELSGWFIPADPSGATVLFCHGNAGNISHRLEYIRIFHGLKLNVFIFDYRGYGASSGSPSEQGTYRDAEAAWNYLTQEKRISAQDIIIFGRSLGGAVGAWLAQNRTPGALVLDSAFTSLTELGAEIYPFIPVRLLSRFRYDTLSYVCRYTGPILVIHSRNDDIIPFRHGQKIFETAKSTHPEEVEFLEISGSHNEGFMLSSEHYVGGLQAFISHYVANKDS